MEFTIKEKPKYCPIKEYTPRYNLKDKASVSEEFMTAVNNNLIE